MLLAFYKPKFNAKFSLFFNKRDCLKKKPALRKGEAKFLE
jgi:hypothetical protein